MIRVFLNKTAPKKTVAMIERIADGSLDWRGLTDVDLMKCNYAISSEQTIPACVAKTKKLSNLGIMVYQDIPFVRPNSKTGCSVDFDNTCYYSCRYCYMNSTIMQQRLEGKRWAVSPGDVDALIPNFRHFLTRFKKIAPAHFLRFFSVSDYKEKYHFSLEKLLIVCAEENVKTTVITKSMDAVRIALPLATSVNYSIDNGTYGSPSDIYKFMELWNESFKGNRLMGETVNLPRLFAMIVDFKDLRQLEDWLETYELSANNVQVVAYHGDLWRVRSSLKKAIKPMFLYMLTNGRACCANGRCIGCPIQCGVRDNLTPEPKYKIIQRG